MKDRSTSRTARRISHGQARPEKARPLAQQGQSRQAAQRLATRSIQQRRGPSDRRPAPLFWLVTWPDLPAADDGGAADLHPQPLTQTLRSPFTAALGADQTLDPLLQPIELEAGWAVLEMLPQLVLGLRGALPVEQAPYLCDHLGTLGLDLHWFRTRVGLGRRREVGHDDTSSGVWPPRMNPRSLATSVNSSRS